MKHRRKNTRVAFADWCLFIQAAVLVGAIRLGLWLLPYATLQHLLAGMMALPRSRRGSCHSAERVAWAVIRASRYVPGATCLTQALATQVALVQAGFPACLRIGVARSQGKRFQAHAWVVSGGRVLVGGGDLARYHLLLSQERRLALTLCWAHG